MELLLLWTLLAAIAGAIAAAKGRSVVGWFLLALILTPLVLLVLFVLPSLKADPHAPNPETHVRCPDCRELVLAEARKCKHCGTSLVPASEQPAR